MNLPLGSLVLSRLQFFVLFALLAGIGMAAPSAAAESAADTLYAFEEKITWPEEELQGDETRERLAETKSILRYFAYDVGNQYRPFDRHERRALRSAIYAAKFRLGLTDKFTASRDFLQILRTAQSENRFPCPNIKPSAHAGNTAEFEIEFHGRQPALYLLQAMERLQTCDAKVLGFGEAEEGKTYSLTSLISDPNALPTQDGEARTLFEKALSGNPSTAEALANAQVAVVAPKRLTIKFDSAVWKDDGTMIPARSPAIASLQSLCRELGYEADCIGVDEVVPWFPSANGEIAHYEVKIPHYSLKLRLELPAAYGDAITEDVAQHVVWLNRRKQLSYVPKPEIKNVNVSGSRPLLFQQRGADSADFSGRGTVAGNAMLEQDEREKFRELRSRILGWPKRSPSQTKPRVRPEKQEHNQFDILLLDPAEEYSSDWGDSVFFPECDEDDFNKSAVPEPQIRKLYPGALTHGYFSQIRPDADCPVDDTRDSSDGTDTRAQYAFGLRAENAARSLSYSNNSEGPDPNIGHALFALGILKGRVGNSDWGGFAHNEHQAIVEPPDSHVLKLDGEDSDKSLHELIFPANDNMKSAYLNKQMDYSRPDRKGASKKDLFFPEIVVVSADNKFCLPAGTPQNLQRWSDKLQKFFKDYGNRASPGLLVIGAPYRTERVTVTENGPEQCIDLASGGDEWVCEPNENSRHGLNYPNAPFVCAAMENPSHIILVGSTDKNLTRMSPRHFRPKGTNGLTDKYLLAPGCDMVSADIEAINGTDEYMHVYRRDSECSSSWAAPAAAALISQLKRKYFDAEVSRPELREIPAGINIKAHLIATSNLPAEEDKDDVYGVINWARAMESDPRNFTVWYEGFPTHLRREGDLQGEIGDVCTAYDENFEVMPELPSMKMSTNTVMSDIDRARYKYLSNTFYAGLDAVAWLKCTGEQLKFGGTPFDDDSAFFHYNLAEFARSNHIVGVRNITDPSQNETGKFEFAGFPKYNPDDDVKWVVNRLIFPRKEYSKHRYPNNCTPRYIGEGTGQNCMTVGHNDQIVAVDPYSAMHMIFPGADFSARMSRHNGDSKSFISELVQN